MTSTAAENYLIHEGHKYLWDGKTYTNEEEAKKIAQSYERSDFQTTVVGEKEEFLVYTRRVVKEVVIEGEAPP
jgi:hypothetical protein